MNKILETLKSKWDALQPRERVMLVGLCVVLLCMLGYVLIGKYNDEQEKLEKEIQAYKNALTYLADNQFEYQKQLKLKNEAREKLLAADAKIGSLLTSMASTLGFDVTVSPSDAHKTSDDSGAEKQEIKIEIKKADYTKFLQYMVDIQKMESPIYMSNIKMTRSSNNSTSETNVSASITLVSYRLKEQNAQ